MGKYMDNETLKKLHEVEIEILDEIVRICDKHNLIYFLYGGTLLGAVRHKGFIPWDDDLDIAMPRPDYEKFLEIANSELKDKYIVDNFKNNKLYCLNFTKIRKKNTLFVQNFQTNYKGPMGIWVDILPIDSLVKEKSFWQDCRIKFIKFLRAVAHYRSGIFLGNKLQWIKRILGIIFKIVPAATLMKLADKLMKKNYKKDTKYYIGIASQYNFRKQTMLKEKFLPPIELEFEGKLYKAPRDYEYFLSRIYGDYMKLPPEEKRVTHNPEKIEFDCGDE